MRNGEMLLADLTDEEFEAISQYGGLVAVEFPLSPPACLQLSTLALRKTLPQLPVIARVAIGRYIAGIHPAPHAFLREEATEVTS
jgi:hypothetical protein